MGETGDAAAVVIACLASAAAVALLWATLAVRRAAREFAAAADELRQEAIPLLAEMGAAVATADEQLSRADGLLLAAEEVSATADEAARVAYQAFSRPVIKALAFGTGTGQAARRFRRLRRGIDSTK